MYNKIYNTEHGYKNEKFEFSNDFWYKVYLGRMLVSYMRQDMVNKLAPRIWKIKGISESSQKAWNKITSRSELLLSNQKGESILFDEGKSLLSLFVINGEVYIEFLKIINYQKVLGNVINAWAIGSQIFEIDGKNQLQILHYTFSKSGKPIVRYGYSAEFSKSFFTKNINTNDTFKDFKEYSKVKGYPTQFTFENIDFLPVEVIPNNYKMLGDIETFEAHLWVAEIDRQSNILGDEVNLTKNNVNMPDQITGNDSANETRQKYAKKNFHKIAVTDANYLQYIQALATDKNALLNLEASLNWFVDKLEKYTGHLRDTTGTGTNKFNNEVLMFNQIALEMLITKVAVRNEYFARFVKRVFEFLNNNAILKQDTENITVELQISEIEQIKLDTLHAQAENLKTIKTDKNQKGNKNEKNI